MIRRSAWLLALVPTAWGAHAASAPEVPEAPSASLSPKESTAEGTCRNFPGLNQLFSFGAGFGLAGPPVIGPGGAIYLGTADGYVHRLHSDGSFHWSYTVKGPVTGRMAWATEAGVLIVPAPHHLYGLSTDGGVSWSSQSQLAVQSGIARDSGRHFRFVTADDRVRGITDRGRPLRGYIPGKARVTAGPFTVAGGFAVGRADGTISVVRRGKTRTFSRKRAIQALVTCPGTGLCAIAGHVLSPVGAPRRSFKLPAVFAEGARATDTGEAWLAVLPTDSRLELFSSLPGEPRYRLDLPGRASAAPAVDARGTTYLPLSNGALLIVSREGVITGCAAVADSPLGTPVVDASRRRVLATWSEGALAAFELP